MLQYLTKVIIIYNILAALIVFYIYSIIGYIVEVSFIFFKSKKLTLSRGFLIGPYLPIFGIGALIILYPLHKYENDLFVLFMASFLLCGILEYITSFIMEKIYGFRWWDYSEQKYNINGRICLENLLGFGIIAILLIKFVNPIIVNFVYLINEKTIIISTCCITVIFITDLVISLIIANDLKYKLNLEKFKDSTKEIKEEVKKRINESNLLIKRTSSSFPNIKKNLELHKENIKNRFRK